MADVMTAAQRSHCMSRIKGKNTSAEMELRKSLWASGLRYRIHAKLPGRPDIVFTKAKVAVFIDGCFWHRCPIHGAAPKTNAEFWKIKLDGNVQRDKRTDRELKRQGWRVLRFWEHEVAEEMEKVTRKITATVVRKKNIAANSI